jgi:hypothetical protein
MNVEKHPGLSYKNQLYIKMLHGDIGYRYPRIFLMRQKCYSNGYCFFPCFSVGSVAIISTIIRLKQYQGLLTQRYLLHLCRDCTGMEPLSEIRGDQAGIA